MREIQQWPKSIPRRIVANRLFVHISIFPALTLLGLTGVYAFVYISLLILSNKAFALPGAVDPTSYARCSPVLHAQPAPLLCQGVAGSHWWHPPASGPRHVYPLRSQPGSLLEASHPIFRFP